MDIETGEVNGLYSTGQINEAERKEYYKAVIKFLTNDTFIVDDLTVLEYRNVIDDLMEDL